MAHRTHYYYSFEGEVTALSQNGASMNLIQRFLKGWRDSAKLYPPSKGGRGEKPTTPAPPPPKGEGGSRRRDLL